MFTSKLPRFATSAKRPSGPSDGSISLSSNIPVSVRKANLFTPQPKRSHQWTFSSSKPYMTTEKKYQRLSKPAPDNDEQNRMFEALVDYLKANAPGFPTPDARKFFSAVSMTETTRIFEVLLSKFIPNLKINKLEVDVPEALEALGYPYIRSVTKSSLVSVTTRRAVGNLLVIFDWLVRYDKRFGDATSDIRSSEQGLASVILLDLVEGKEATKENDLDPILAKKREELEEIEAELNQLEEKKCEIEEAEEINERLENNIKEFDIYLDQMVLYVEEYQTKERDLDSKITKLDEEIEEGKNRLELLKSDPIPNHELSHVSIDQLRDELQTIEKAIEVARANGATQRSKAQCDGELKDLEGQNKQIEYKLSRRKREVVSETEKLKIAEEKERQLESRCLSLLRETFEANKQVAFMLAEDIKRDNEWWKLVEQRVTHNHKVIQSDLVRQTGLDKT